MQALSVVDPADNLEEAIFLAIEMIRLDLLNTKPWFSHVSGGPMRGSEDDKTFNMLVSRLACVAKLQHKSIGYSGPLSRQLLCYRSLISEVRSALRNLIEVVLAGLLLSGDADRDRNDWTEMAIKYVPMRLSMLKFCANPVFLGFPLLTITIVDLELRSELTSTTFPYRQTRRRPRLARM